MIQLPITRNELIDHDEGFTTMRLHVTLPNGAHYFFNEDEWHVGSRTEESVKFAETLNSELENVTSSGRNGDGIRIVQLVASDGSSEFINQAIFALVDVEDLRK